jgi:ferric-dicitrate binding protein FerR (iron transport regulator)
MNNKYLTYNSLDLAAEEAFIDWVRDGVQDAEWKKWLKAHPEKGNEIAEAQKLINTISYKTVKIEPKTKADIWAQIDAATPSTVLAPVKKQLPRRLFIISSITTVAASLFILYMVFLRPDAGMDIHTGIGNQVVVNLPDQSNIKLNAVSEVQYDKKTFAKERKLKLKGEGFFEVAKGSTFTVLTEHGSVEVLGTSFNVYSRGDSLAVACYTGRVRVSNGKEEVILTPGESVSYNSKAPQIAKDTFAKASESPSWTTGSFVFENEKLSVIFAELQRQYDVTIKYNDPSIPEMVAGVAIFENGNLTQALNDITYLFKLSYTIDGDRIVITK